jgi:hypothetical protein
MQQEDGMPRLTNAEALRKAANIMKKKGHAKHELEDKQGRVCLLGAINMALFGRPASFGDKRSDSLLSHVAAYLSRKLGKRVTDFGAVDWNNDRQRKGEEVIAALRGTARVLAR